jgi:hypothetical protein
MIVPAVFIILCAIETARACGGLRGIPSVPITGIGGGGRTHEKKCLHEDAMVLMADGGQKRAGDLVIGDRVWNEGDQSSPVVLMPNSDPHEFHSFITFKTKSGLGTSMTPDHAVFARECGGQGPWPIKRSGDLTIGECVPTVQGGEDAVVAITMTNTNGRVHPITASGKLVADGILVSCYDYAGDNSTQETTHAPFEPVRMLYSLGEKFYNSLSDEQYAIGLLESLIRGMGLEKIYE